LYFHCDESFMPHNSSAWSARNFLGTTSNGVCVTYWLNILQVLLVWLFFLCMMDDHWIIYIIFHMTWKKD
jgi:predicted NAD/FAD-binding protein